MKTPLHKIFGYAVGEGAFTLSMNGIGTFALIYYTQVLGLGPSYAGLALSVTVIWDAVSDPVMGHVTDHTRTRFGRRHPYMLGGGLLLALSFFFLWFVPSGVVGSTALFWYLLLMNLVVRTAVTVFVVPYTALGFEMCVDYEERSKLQSIRFFMNQIVNFSGSALAWSLFFGDGEAADGTRIDGTKIKENYATMSIWLTLAIGLLVVACVYFTRHYAQDNRAQIRSGNDLKSFWRDLLEILSDRLALYVFSSKFIIVLGMMFVAQIQIFTYVGFMGFSAAEKTIAHGAGMLSFAGGSLFHAWLVKRLDKKATAFVGMGVGAIGSGMLFLLFIGGLMPTQFRWVVSEGFPLFAGVELPVAVYVFALFQGMWWGGMGMVAPLMLSMVADISEINYVNTGKQRDGSYSAMFSFFMKAAMGLGMFLNGWILEFAGYESGVDTQNSETLRNLAIITFVAGPIALLPLIPILKKYPVNRAFMKAIKRRRSEMESDG